jgi:beta-mannanase
MNCSVSPCTYYPFPTSVMNTIRSRGSIPFFNWGSGSSPVSRTQSNFELRDITAGTYDTYIRNFATAAKNWAHPFFLNFDAEMNGSWSPWGVLTNGNTGADFVPMWRHVHDIFTSVGANNVTWVWTPNSEYGTATSGSYKPLSNLYPGDAYVDYTGLDSYNWGTDPGKPNVWWTFAQTIGPHYNTITGIAPSKPFIIAETASTEYGGSKAAWITDMLSTQIPLYFPKLKGFLWFEKRDCCEWPIETSTTSKSAFSTGIQSSLYAANSFAALGNTKIAPLR